MTLVILELAIHTEVLGSIWCNLKIFYGKDSIIGLVFAQSDKRMELKSALALQSVYSNLWIMEGGPG